MWRNSGGTEQWWLNLFDGILLERERKKNLRINRAVSMSVVDELRPFLQPGRSPKGLDVLSVENNWPWPYTFWRIKAFLRWRCVSTVPLFLCVNCSSGPCCKLFLWSYVSSVSFFFLVLCLQRFSGSVNHLFLWSCVPTVSLFLNAYCSFIPECLVFPWSCISTIPSLACA